MSNDDPDLDVRPDAQPVDGPVPLPLSSEHRELYTPVITSWDFDACACKLHAASRSKR